MSSSFFCSRHDFIMANFLPFSQSHLSNQFLTWKGYLLKIKQLEYSQLDSNLERSPEVWLTLLSHSYIVFTKAFQTERPLPNVIFQCTAIQ